jgi:error-prone DNA polymerase
MPLGEQVCADYASLRLSLKAHPLALLRPALDRAGITPAGRLLDLADGRRLAVAGLVLVRQRPGTASGVIFVTLEDETGIANLVVWPQVFERHRRALLGAQLMVARGRLQREGIVVHLVADRLEDRTAQLRRLADSPPSVPDAAVLTAPLARADEVKRPGSDRRHVMVKSRDFH